MWQIKMIAGAECWMCDRSSRFPFTVNLARAVISTAKFGLFDDRWTQVIETVGQVRHEHCPRQHVAVTRSIQFRNLSLSFNLFDGLLTGILRSATGEIRRGGLHGFGCSRERPAGLSQSPR